VNEDNDGFDGLIDDNWNDINYDVDFDDEFYYDEDLEDDILLAEIFNVIYQDNKIGKNIQNSSKNIEKILFNSELFHSCYNYLIDFDDDFPCELNELNELDEVNDVFRLVPPTMTHSSSSNTISTMCDSDISQDTDVDFSPMNNEDKIVRWNQKFQNDEKNETNNQPEIENESNESNIDQNLNSIPLHPQLKTQLNSVRFGKPSPGIIDSLCLICNNFIDVHNCQFCQA
jgi:hypothetical protein